MSGVSGGVKRIGGGRGLSQVVNHEQNQAELESKFRLMTQRGPQQIRGMKSF
jgi:hypothetical protein